MAHFGNSVTFAYPSAPLTCHPEAPQGTSHLPTHFLQPARRGRSCCRRSASGGRHSKYERGWTTLAIPSHPPTHHHPLHPIPRLRKEPRTCPPSFSNRLGGAAHAVEDPPQAGGTRSMSGVGRRSPHHPDLPTLPPPESPSPRPENPTPPHPPPTPSTH